MLTSTHSIRSKLNLLLGERTGQFLHNSGFYDDDELARMWDRYLLSFGCILEKTISKPKYIRVQDPILQRGILLPKEMAEKILILNMAPPIPIIETVRDLSLRAFVREYRLEKYNIPVTQEVLTKNNLYLLDRQIVDVTDYPSKEKVKKIMKDCILCIPLKSKIISINGTEVEIEIKRLHNLIRLHLLVSNSEYKD